MPYDVRTPDGELSYVSLYDVERAYANGLVGPEDELRVPGGAWQKVKDVAALKSTLTPERRKSPTRNRTLLISGAGIASLVLLFTGHFWEGVGLAVLVAAFSLRLTAQAWRK